MKIEIINGKEYRKIKEYEHYTLYEDIKTGFKECFDNFDLGKIKRRSIKEVNLSIE